MLCFSRSREPAIVPCWALAIRMRSGQLHVGEIGRCEIDKGPRAQEKPSDHAPIIVTYPICRNLRANDVETRAESSGADRAAEERSDRQIASQTRIFEIG